MSVFGVTLVRIFPHSDWIRRYTVSLRIQSEYGKMQTRITPHMDTFYAVVTFKVMSDIFLLFYLKPLKPLCYRRAFWNSGKKILFHFKSSFLASDIQILEFLDLKHHDVMLKHETRNTFPWIIWEVNTVCSKNILQKMRPGN